MPYTVWKCKPECSQSLISECSSSCRLSNQKRDIVVKVERHAGLLLTRFAQNFISVLYSTGRRSHALVRISSHFQFLHFNGFGNACWQFWRVPILVVAGRVPWRGKSHFCRQADVMSFAKLRAFPIYIIFSPLTLRCVQRRCAATAARLSIRFHGLFDHLIVASKKYNQALSRNLHRHPCRRSGFLQMAAITFPEGLDLRAAGHWRGRTSVHGRHRLADHPRGKYRAHRAARTRRAAMDPCWAR